MILATNIAETSVTIPGIKYVIDPGLVKVRSYSSESGIDSLITVETSKSQAHQRRLVAFTRTVLPNIFVTAMILDIQKKGTAVC